MSFQHLYTLLNIIPLLSYSTNTNYLKFKKTIIIIFIYYKCIIVLITKMIDNFKIM